jgi:hypothetical protein
VTDATALLLPDGRAVGTAPITCDVPADGLALRLTVPSGRGLAAATLRIAAPAPSAVPRAFTDATLLSDRGGFPGDGDTVAWLRLTLAQERAVAGIRLLGAATDQARLRILSRGVWRPLTPPDTIALAPDTNARPVSLTPVAASALMAEFLGPFTPAPNAPPVFLPAARKVSGMVVFGTDQPCYVAVSVGSDPAFFQHEGPLQAAPIEVVGLLLAAGRYLADNPGAVEIPLRITAAGPGQIILQDFSTTLRPLVGQDYRPSGGSGQPVETLVPPGLNPVAAAAQLCDAAHLVAQRLDPPICNATIGSLGLYLSAGATPLQGAVALHGGTERPDPQPLWEQPAASLPTVPEAPPHWATCRLKSPWRPGAPVWVVCRITAGEAFWFTAPARPAGVGPLLTSSGGGGWEPASAAGVLGWAQIRVGVVPGG